MDPNQLRLQMNVRIDNMYGGGGLNISEDMTIDNLTFPEMANILGQFHEVMQAIKRAREVSPSPTPP